MGRGDRSPGPITKDQTDPNLPTLNYKPQRGQKNVGLLNCDPLPNLRIVEEQPLNVEAIRESPVRTA
ncbi:hypothetical protein Oscil6304_3033 [Oscillatoria acuminata PCC 6304]|uniref:Uncharacterized protein n=1 Tax=Oscillatoria acuminata PCC 6304 TaxID=56110 RepID=K9TJP5_9CYAN|nr:hypothetical protein Oscil6304_3033 [Oscillatoria acuminata PCC 6304]